jgi:hypothetical protein
MSEQTNKRAPAATAGMRTTAPAGFRVSPDHIDSQRGDGVRALRPVEPDPDEPREFAVVARGRSVDAPTEQRRAVGYDPVKGEQLYAAVQRRFMPGETIELPVSEIRRLRELGFLIAPDAAPIFTSGRLS